MYRAVCFSLFVLSTGSLGRLHAEEPTMKKTYAGAVTGTVSKVDSGSITVKVPTTVQSGVTRRHVGGRTISIPRYTTKQVENTLSLSPDVTVKTVSGKTAAMEDVRPGVSVRLHAYTMTERSPGEKSKSHVEVLKIEVPSSAPAK